MFGPYTSGLDYRTPRPFSNVDKTILDHFYTTSSTSLLPLGAPNSDEAASPSSTTSSTNSRTSNSRRGGGGDPQYSTTSARVQLPVSSDDNARRRQPLQRMLSNLLMDGSQRISASIIDHCIATGDAYVFDLLLTRYATLLDWSYCGPVRKAVDTERYDFLVKLLDVHSSSHLKGTGFDINVGCPLRQAAVLNLPDYVQILVRHPDINPNKGCPLFYAVQSGDYSMVKNIGEHPGTNVNRFTSTQGTTPLCAAIDASCSLSPLPTDGGRDGALVSEAIVGYLVAHPRMDLNRGYFSTPLQLAVAGGNVRIINLLLQRPTLDLNKAAEGTKPPLEIAMRDGCENREVMEMLIADPRCLVEEELVDFLEEVDDRVALQLIMDADSVIKTGRIWNSRFAYALLLLTIMTLQVIVDVRLLYTTVSQHFAMEAFVLLATHQISGGICTALLFRHYPAFVTLLRLVPFIALLETRQVVLVLLYSSVKPSVDLRHELFSQFNGTVVFRARYTSLPVVIAICGLAVLNGVHSELVGNLLLCVLLHIGFFLLCWRLNRVTCQQLQRVSNYHVHDEAMINVR